MTRTRTIYTNFQDLSIRGESAIVILKLMMAFNDLSLANQALSRWQEEQPNCRKVRQVGAKMYFVRIQISHLYEGLKIIDAIRKDPALSNLVGRCGRETQRAFHKLEEFLPEGKNRKEFEKLVGQIRHNLTFHYNESGRLIKRAILDRATCGEANNSSITASDDASSWHFKVADDVVDSIVVRQIWDIPRNTDLRSEVDKTLDRVYEIFLWFVTFSAGFIWKYLNKP
jgi:hypothetical protein